MIISNSKDGLENFLKLSDDERGALTEISFSKPTEDKYRDHWFIDLTLAM